MNLKLKSKYFDAGLTTEIYKEITPYWIKRLTNNKFETQNNNLIIKLFLDLPINWIEFKQFNLNIINLGQQSIKLEHKGIEMRTGNPEQGYNSDKFYFVIKNGKIIN